MYRLIRYWNQNKKTIIKVLMIIIFLFLIIQIMNITIKKKNEDNLSNMSENSNNTTNVTKEEAQKGLMSDQSAITGQNISKEKLKNATDIIYNFVDYCNKQDLNNAYNLLTEDCKQQMFTSVESFKNGYYNNVFGGQKKNCIIENWTGNTYKVDIKDDILSIGKDSGYSKQDYITIEESKGEYKLNINNYIGFKKIDKKTSKDNITMDVVGRNVYKDYEEYNIKVTNNTKNNIQLDSVNSAKTLYLEDSNGAKYSYYNHELTDQTLTVSAGQTKEVTIKFYSAFVSTKNIKYIVFSNIISKNDQLTDQLEFKANV